MIRKPETAEQLLADDDRRAAALVRRTIQEGKARHSAAGRMYPNLQTDAQWRTVEVARRPTETTAKSRAQIVYPNLPRGTR